MRIYTHNRARPPCSTWPPPMAPPSSRRVLISNTSVADSVVGPAHERTIASLIPELGLTNEEAQALADYLPKTMNDFVEDRRATLEVPWDLWD
ncbi:hypothetical protein N7501_004395 [Penicillium viridicatum]|nr:hypothetical protein N7501_004395 [Penicillium viridicatum]